MKRAVLICGAIVLLALVVESIVAVVQTSNQANGVAIRISHPIPEPQPGTGEGGQSKGEGTGGAGGGGSGPSIEPSPPGNTGTGTAGFNNGPTGPIGGPGGSGSGPEGPPGKGGGGGGGSQPTDQVPEQSCVRDFGCPDRISCGTMMGTGVVINCGSGMCSSCPFGWGNLVIKGYCIYSFENGGAAYVLLTKFGGGAFFKHCLAPSGRPPRGPIRSL